MDQVKKVLVNFFNSINPLLFYCTIIYALSKFFESNGMTIWQNLWKVYMDLLGDNEAIHIIVGMNAFLYPLYWCVGSIFYLLEFSDAAQKYKINEKKGEIGSNIPMAKVIKVTIKNHILTFAAILIGYQTGIANFKVTRNLPNFTIVMRDVVFCMMLYDIVFYYTHRLLHHPKLYYLHKRHHEVASPISFAAFYTDSFDHLVTNVIPIAAGPVLISINLSTFFVYITLVAITEFNNHSGYHLPFLRSTEAHHFHHARSNGVFSGYGYIDFLHGTSGNFLKSKYYERHYTRWKFNGKNI